MVGHSNEGQQSHVLEDSTGSSSFGTLHVAKSVHKSSNAVDDAGHESGESVLNTSDHDSDHDHWELLQEVELDSLAAINFEPVSIGKLFGVPSRSAIWIAILWGLIVALHILCVHLVELAHEPSLENGKTRTHCELINRKNIGDDDQQKSEEHCWISVESVVHF